MKDYLEKLPRELRNLMAKAAEIASSNGMSVYLVGGFVRDLILGVKNFDLDFVVEGDGIRFAEEFARQLNASLTRHRRFGTATVVLTGSVKVDIASAREECYPEPACLPSVKKGTVQDDLKRRDFTINAMAVSLNSTGYATLVDFFGGLDDLRKKKIRILHCGSFIDDPTRILRAIRFEQRFGFRIEPKTFECLKKAVAMKMLEKVQPHRVRDELILILKEAFPIKQIKRLQQLTGFRFIHPHTSVTKGVLNFLQSVSREIEWFKKTYPRRRHLDSWLIYVMALVDKLTVAELKGVLKAYAFRKGEEKRVLTYKKISNGFIRQLSEPAIRPSAIFNLLEPLSYEAILLLKAKYANRYLRGNIKNFFTLYNGTRLSISGEDLRRLGVPPGPLYQRILSRVLRAKLNGSLKSKEEELAFVKRLVHL